PVARRAARHRLGAGRLVGGHTRFLTERLLARRPTHATARRTCRTARGHGGFPGLLLAVVHHGADVGIELLARGAHGAHRLLAGRRARLHAGAHLRLVRDVAIEDLVDLALLV